MLRCCTTQRRPKFARWFCGKCLERVREVNEACGLCAIPIGWHSIVNSVFSHSNRCKTLTGATAAADQLNAFFKASTGAWEWGKGIIERHWITAGLPLGIDVLVEDYLDAVLATGPDKLSLFNELVAARGIPPYWRDFEAIPLQLIWQEEGDDGRLLVAHEEIIWQYPDGEDCFADLTLRVVPAGTGWLWEVVLDDEAAGEDDPLLAHGTAFSVEEAKATCDSVAQDLIVREEGRSSRQEAEEREAQLNPSWEFPFCPDIVQPSQDWNYVHFDFKQDDDEQ